MVNGKLFDHISVDKAILGTRLTLQDVFSDQCMYRLLRITTKLCFFFFPQSNYSFRMIVTVNSD